MKMAHFNQEEKERSAKTPIYIITGFLGSGKTTLLSNLLKILPFEKVGMIFNEFGALEVDAESLGEKEDYYITPLNNGQIFCSCLSGKFVESILALKKNNIQCLLVESSGLAKPRTLGGILEEVENLADDFYEYKGMVCVIDAVSFLLLSQALTTVSEQIYYSDLLIINKTDLVSSATLEKVREYVSAIKPGLPMVFTSYGQVDKEVFPILDQQRLSNNSTNKVEVYEPRQGIKDPDILRLTVYPKQFMTRDELEFFLGQVTVHVLRAKGFLIIGKEYFRINAVGKDFEIRPCQPASFKEPPIQGLTILALAEARRTILELVSQSRFEVKE